jgi:hypothetical protein
MTMLINKALGRSLVSLTCLVAIIWALDIQPARALSGADPTVITEIRGKKLFLYDGPSGKVVERKGVEEFPDPLRINITGKEQNGRYPVEIDGKAYWVGKAQVKETDVETNKITAECQSVTKAFASSRGLGNCN